MHGKNLAEAIAPASQPEGEAALKSAGETMRENISGSATGMQESDGGFMQPSVPMDLGPLNRVEAEECEGFRPTRHELKEIARFWYRTYLQGWHMLLSDRAGGEETLRWARAQQRIREIVPILGDDAMNAVFDSVEQDAGKPIGDRYRLIFPSGRDEDWKALVRLSCLLNRKLDAQPEEKHPDAEKKCPMAQDEHGSTGNRTHRHQDSEGLGVLSDTPPEPGAPPSWVIGYVPEVNGAEAEETDAFRPTRHELKELVRFWYRAYMDHKYDWIFHDMHGSTESRRMIYAMRRIHRIESVIGEAAAKEMLDSVDEDARKELGDEHWRILKRGTEEERQNVREEMYRQLAAEGDRGTAPAKGTTDSCE